MEYAERERYLKRIEPFAFNGNAKVLTGIRRSGKSTLLEMVSDRNGSENNVIAFNMEIWKNREYRDGGKLYDKVKSLIVSDKKNVLLIDEIQDVSGWEEIIRSLIAEKCCDIYLTGSNSRLLSGEYATYLSGRLNTIDVFTLVFSECLFFEKKYRGHGDIDSALSKFLRIGGFPSGWRSDYSEQAALSEISDIIQAIMMRDIVERHQVKKPDALNRILRYICDNIGNPISVNNIYTALAKKDGSVGRDAVYAYVDYLEAACMIHRAETYDVKGKEILRSKYKYYVSDIGIKNALIGFRPDDISGYMENILYLELRSRGYRVWVGENNGREIDLVGDRNGSKIYVQATARLSDGKVVRREFGNLRGIEDNYPKYVVTLENSPLDADMDGIICCKLTDFLLMEDY